MPLPVKGGVRGGLGDLEGNDSSGIASSMTPRNDKLIPLNLEKVGGAGHAGVVGADDFFGFETKGGMIFVKIFVEIFFEVVFDVDLVLGGGGR